MSVLNRVKRLVCATLAVVFPQVLIEGTALTVRCILTVLLVLIFPHWGVMSFALAQVSSVGILGLTLVTLCAILSSCKTVSLFLVLPTVFLLIFCKHCKIWKCHPPWSCFMSLSIIILCYVNLSYLVHKPIFIIMVI